MMDEAGWVLWAQCFSSPPAVRTLRPAALALELVVKASGVMPVCVQAVNLCSGGRDGKGAFHLGKMGSRMEGGLLCRIWIRS